MKNSSHPLSTSRINKHLHTMIQIPTMKIVGSALLAILLLLGLSPPAAKTDNGRDWRQQPFTSESPWNYPIGSNAEYKSVTGLNNLSLGLNYDERWSTGIYVATPADRMSKIFYSKDTWRMLNEGIVKNAGNSAEIESALRSAASEQIIPIRPSFSGRNSFTELPSSSIPTHFTVPAELSPHPILMV
jgi:hypothetical protein